MGIVFNNNGTVSVRMKEYLKEAITDFVEDITKSATSPAKRDIFDVNEESEDLSAEKREVFHSVTAKLLYVSKRGRSDIQLATAFLCTRVKYSTK
jgi:hypothetical protein